MHTPTAAEMIRALDLKPHPEGGHYRETFRDPRLVEGRPASTAILFLLARGERSHWHRIDAVEIWHYYAGAPLKLSLVDGSKEEIFRLGADINAGEVPQVTVPARAWQAAESLGPWTLTGCTVAPGFFLRRFRTGTQRLVAAMMRSWPDLFRPSTSCFIVVTTWMPGTGPGMTN